MARGTFFERLNVFEQRELIGRVPQQVRLDVIQFGLDLAGLNPPAADAAETFISLLRGDLLEGASSAAIIVPADDEDRLARIKRHRKSFEALVNLSCEHTKLARSLDVLVRQLQEQLGKISGYLLQGGSKSTLLEEWNKEFRLIEKTIA